MSAPLFPSLIPEAVDSLWFYVDKPSNDENELVKVEQEHKDWLEGIAKKCSNIVPIGRQAAEQPEEEDDEDDDDEGDDDDDSETNDEMEPDMINDRDSVEDAEIGTYDADVMSPAWGV